MIDQIIVLREKGYSFRNIARELRTTVGKVQYRYQKYQEELNRTNHQPSESLFEERYDLPSSYQRDELTLLPQSPTSLYACWEVADATREMVEHHCRKPWVDIGKQLRMNDITGLNFNGHNAHRFFDIGLPEMTNNWYVHGLEANRTYIVDLGVWTNEGTFLTILRSNAIETPRKKEERGSHVEAVHQWREGNQDEPNWLEHFSTYSYYESIK